MDLITHFLVPYAVLFMLKSKYKLEGAFGGISLDFDVLIVWVGILFPELFIFSHRGITHSFIFGFVTSVLFLYVVSRKPVKELVGKIIHRDLPLSFTRTTVMVVFFGALTHLFLDSLTSKGIPLLYPFTITRFSVELYYYLNFITIVIATAVLIVLYLRLDSKYKKAALTVFMVILISFGGIRAYEKADVLQTAATIGDIYPQIYAYPSNDMFTWSVVKINSNNTQYQVFQYNNQNNSVSDFKNASAVTVNNGSYISAWKAIETANQIPQVQRFKWDSYYTIIYAQKNPGKWNITYSNLLSSPHGMDNDLTVFV